MIKSSQREQDQLARQQLQPERYTAGQQQDKALHGRLLYRTFTKDLQGNPATRRYLGLVHFRGKQPGGNLLVTYEDGDAEVTTRQSLKAAAVEWLPEGTPVPAGVRFPTPAEAYEYIRQSAQLRSNNAAATRATRSVAVNNNGYNTRNQSQRRARAPPAPANNNEPAPESRHGRRNLSKARQSAAASLAAVSSRLPTVVPWVAASPMIAGVIQAGTTAHTATDELCLVAVPAITGSPYLNRLASQ